MGKLYIYLLILFLLSVGCNHPDQASISASICNGANDLTTLAKHTSDKTHGLANDCTQNSDGDTDFMVVESPNQPKSQSAYFESADSFYEAFDFLTQSYKFSSLYTNPSTGAKPHKIVSPKSNVKKNLAEL